MDILKITVDLPGTGDPPDVDAQIYQWSAGVGWLPAGAKIGTTTTDFAVDIAAALTAGFAGND